MTAETALINLRNTLSGISSEYSPEDAERILAHPVYGKVNKVVKSPKPELLGHPFPADSVTDTTEAEVETPDPDALTFGDETKTSAEKKDTNK